MQDGFIIYYLVLFGLYTILPAVFWLHSKLSRKVHLPQSKNAELKSETRGHFMVSIFLSLTVLSILPFVFSSIKAGKDPVTGVVFMAIVIAVAMFFLWMGITQLKANRKRLRDAEAEYRKQEGKDLS